MTLIHRLLLTLCLFTLPLTAAAALHDQVAEQLRDRLEVATAEAGNGDADPERSPLHRFFLDRVYRPAWSEDGQPTARAEQLLAVLAESRGHGLAPAAYGYDQLSETLRDWPEEPAPGAVADLELQLTRVWLQLAEDALTGQLNPDVVAPDWELQSPPSEDLVQALSQGLAEDDIATAVRQLYPDQDNYHQMRRALSRFQALAEQGDYPRMEAGPLLRVGDRDPGWRPCASSSGCWATWRTTRRSARPCTARPWRPPCAISSAATACRWTGWWGRVPWPH